MCSHQPSSGIQNVRRAAQTALHLDRSTVIGALGQADRRQLQGHPRQRRVQPEGAAALDKVQKHKPLGPDEIKELRRLKLVEGRVGHLFVASNYFFPAIGAIIADAFLGKYRTVFDVELKQQGTYRIATVNKGLMVRWEGADGKPGGLRGAKPEDLATKVPKDAKNLQVSQSVGRIETFVTNGAPNDTALKATGEGIELMPVTHPNDLFAGEAATFRMLIDGKPAAGLEFEITRGGTRYRNAQEEIKVTTDASGEFSVTWPEAGMYWLETGTEDNKTSVKQAAKRRLSYVATLEVLPQ